MNPPTGDPIANVIQAIDRALTPETKAALGNLLAGFFPAIAAAVSTIGNPAAAAIEDAGRTLEPVSSAVTAYLSGLAPGSRRGMTDALERLAGLLGKTSAAEVAWHRLGFEQTSALQSQLLATGMAPDYCKKHRSALFGVLKASKRLGLMSGDQYDRAVDLERIRGSRIKRVKNLKPGDVAALLAATRDDPKMMRGLRDRALLGLLDGGGLRRAEAASLVVSAFDRGTRRLQVIGKGNKERVVPLPVHAADWIAEFIDARGAGGSDPILCPVSQPGEPLNRPLRGGQAVYVVLRRLFERAGVEGSPPHAFRRGFITSLLRKGVDVIAVKEIVGHSSVDTTAGYDQRGIDDYAPAVDRLPNPEVRP